MPEAGASAHASTDGRGLKYCILQCFLCCLHPELRFVENGPKRAFAQAIYVSRFGFRNVLFSLALSRVLGTSCFGNYSGLWALAAFKHASNDLAPNLGQHGCCEKLHSQMNISFWRSMDGLGLGCLGIWMGAYLLLQQPLYVPEAERASRAIWVFLNIPALESSHNASIPPWSDFRSPPPPPF